MATKPPKNSPPQETQFVDPEEIARSAIKELTNLSDKLDDKRNDEEGATFDAIKDMTRKLNSPQPGASLGDGSGDGAGRLWRSQEAARRNGRGNQ